MFLRFSNEVFNTVHLGFGFLLLFSADFTINNLMPVLYKQIALDNPEFTVNGYVGLGGLYFTYSISLWLAPSINEMIGPKLGLIIGAIFVTFHILVIEFEKVWLIILGIVCSGFGGSILWVGEGNYIVRNSSPKTVTKNISIFWSIYTTSMIFGNLYTAIYLQGVPKLDRHTRVIILRILTGLGVAAALVFCFLRKPAVNNKTQTTKEGPVKTLVKTFRLYITKPMAMLICTFIYSGFQQSFGWGIYSTCVGFTNNFGTMKTQLVPLTSMTYGFGDSLGGFFHMISSRNGIKWSRRWVIAVGALLQVLAFALTFVNLPNDSVFGPTDQISLINPSVALALICSFMIGIGDSCLNTQIFSLLAHLHPDHSANTSALYKFTKCIAMAGFFFVGNSVALHYQLIVLTLLSVIGSVTFFFVDLTADGVKTFQIRAEPS